MGFRSFMAAVSVFLSCGVFSQDLNTISGKVLSEGMQIIRGATIENTSMKAHAHTDFSGVFKIAYHKTNDTIYISSLGFESKKVIVNKFLPNDTLIVLLKAKAIELNAVVLDIDEKKTLGFFTAMDMEKIKVNSSQELLNLVPGLFVSQHAGGGKAEQIFLRGFDIDHGTDISISIDNMPVNGVSHAHGQGYTDLHFVIPETVQKIDFGKGGYYYDKGNFSTAGFVDYKSKDTLEQSEVKMEYGQFNSSRLFAGWNLINTSTSKFYVASELLFTDGPFESPQNLQRLNITGNLSHQLSATDKIKLGFSYFNSAWDASGQVPERAVLSGQISRFGAIDDTEGGSTSRSNLILNHTKKINDSTTWQSYAYLSQSDFNLYSNFTFFLRDSINGDQIQQQENRTTIGLGTSVKKEQVIGNDLLFTSNYGLSLRQDFVNDVSLNYTVSRDYLSTKNSGDVAETNLGFFYGGSLDFGKLKLDPGIRADFFRFQMVDHLAVDHNTLVQTEPILSPKLNIYFTASPALQFYVKSGKSFHSNDTRTQTVDDIDNLLTSSYGADLGTVVKPTDNMAINFALWNLYLEQEFVYVGDEGIIEPSGQSYRNGVDLSLRYQITDWLYWNSDITYSYGRFVDEEKGNNEIPLAPTWTFVNGFHGNHGMLYYGLTSRFLGDRPANEDASITAEGYFVNDLYLGISKKWYTFELRINNVFDTKWNEAQFATESRLKDETSPVEELHFTPGLPFFAKALVKFKF